MTSSRRWIRVSSTIRNRVALLEWRQRLAPFEALRAEVEPPPGLAERTCRYVASCMPAPPKPLRRWLMSPGPCLPSALRVSAGLTWRS